VTDWVRSRCKTNLMDTRGARIIHQEADGRRDSWKRRGKFIYDIWPEHSNNDRLGATKGKKKKKGSTAAPSGHGFAGTGNEINLRERVLGECKSGGISWKEYWGGRTQ